MELNLSEIEERDSFSANRVRGGSYAWNNSVVDELLGQLKADSNAGTVRSIPIKWIYENLRANYDGSKETLLKHVGWAFRKKFIQRAKVLEIKVEVQQSMCQNGTEEGAVEIKFLE